MLGMDDRPSSIKGVREDIQVSKQQIYSRPKKASNINFT
jgi:hypothetical protein